MYAQVKTDKAPVIAGPSAGTGGVGCKSESAANSIGLITLGVKPLGKRSAGKPHAAFDVAGAGNGATDDPTRARREKSRTQPRDILRATAPALDPTALSVAAVPCNNVQSARMTVAADAMTTGSPTLSCFS